MKLSAPLLSAGGYFIVDDSNINGQPVLPGRDLPRMKPSRHTKHEFQNDYKSDVAREDAFDWTLWYAVAAQ
jgi:cephalosporin hydroxylase